MTFSVGYDIISYAMNNIILIGMPASGKSTAGVLLAKTLGYGFIDSDLLIQNEQRNLLCNIIAEKGVAEFMRIEERVNANLRAERCVIATGGSVVYGERAMNHLRKMGIVVYLRLSLQEIERRLGNIVRRGVVMTKPDETLAELYAERAPLYERYAHKIISCEKLTVEQTVQALADTLSQ